MNNLIRFTVSSVCTAFESETIGSKVVGSTPYFFDMLREQVLAHNTSNDRTPGQHFITLPASTYSMFSAGDGLKSENPYNYVIRKHREGPKMFLRREFAGKVRYAAVIVYTRQAYLDDPDVGSVKGREEIGDATHVIVSVLASSGPKAPLTPFRFCHNLAGGNNDFEIDTVVVKHKDNYDKAQSLALYIQWLKVQAKEIVEYWNTYSVVAD